MTKGTKFRMGESLALAILTLNRAVSHASFDAGLRLGDTYDLARLKVACQAFLDQPLVVALDTEAVFAADV